MRLERTVELDGMDAVNALRQIVGQNSEAGADLEHDVVLLELREAPDHPEDVLVDEEVLAEVAIRFDRELHGSEKAAAAFAAICAPSSSGSARRIFASSWTVRTTFAGSFGRPRRACGARYGLSVSARIRSAGT